MNKINNLYFYMIDISKLEQRSKIALTPIAVGNSKFYKIQEDNDLWIFAKTKVAPGRNDIVSINTTQERIEAIIPLSIEKNLSFNYMFFGIHGADWGIKSGDYNGDAFVLEDFNHLAVYNETMNKTIEFVDKMKTTYKAQDCRLKVFSHTDSSAIHNCYNKDFDNFITTDTQIKILWPKKGQETKESTIPIEQTQFDFPMNQSDPKIERLETLFFEFRLCIATLTALNDNENHDLWEETVNRMIVLIEGGILQRAWTENIIVETEFAEKGYMSLKDNHYTEVGKIPGIGHYVQLYGGKTTRIQKCIELLWNKGASKDELIKNLKKIEPVIKNILEAEQKKRKNPNDV